MNDQALITRSDNTPATVEDIRAQVQLIQQVMSEVMKEGTHYGVVPGCGDKKALLKPGAEKICLAFRLAVSLDVAYVDLERGHRTYTVHCYLKSPSGHLVGEGIGVCSTMESKYRFRSENTGAIVPAEYWQHRDSAILGGPTFKPKKVDNTWVIVQLIEYENAADYYNTCAKMAKKRALVDVTLTATAASDIFVQDLEDDDDPAGTAAAADAPKPAAASAQAQAPQGPRKCTEKQAGMLHGKIRAKAESGGITEAEFCKHYSIGKVEELPIDKVNDALAWINNPAV